MTKLSLNDIEAQIAALGSSSSGDSDGSSLEDVDSSDSASFSGYSCDSSSSEEESDHSDNELQVKLDPNSNGKRAVDFERKANQVARKKSRLGMSSICFKFITGNCGLDDCIFRHVDLNGLSEEEKGELTRDLHKRPFDAELGSKIKNLNIPTCKEFSKTGDCKFNLKCRFWHIATENDAKWAGCMYWCQCCRKAFTSDSQYREHCSGKFHKSKTQ
jgi:hypothetical protein